MQSILLHYFTLWRPLGYLLAFAGMVIEGEAVLFATAFLTHQGYFHWQASVPIVLGGLALGDVAWFWLGTRLGINNSFLARRVIALTDPFLERLRAHPRRTIFVSKFTYGFNHVLIMRAAMTGLDARSFLKADVVATLVWIAAIGSLGYFTSNVILTVRRYLRVAEVALVAGLVVFLLFWKMLSAVFKRGL